MFGRRISIHGRAMGEVRSAQQKCVRRAMLEPLILLNLEHLLSTPDMSRAAVSRMQVIAAEDIGAGAPTLLYELMALESGWAKLEQNERARRLIQASHLCVARTTSRFVPCWIALLLKGVENKRVHWSSLDELLTELRFALKDRLLDRAGLLVEEMFLRHPIERESPLSAPIGLPSSVMTEVWTLLSNYCPSEHRLYINALQKRFGTPSKVSVESRLFLYLALVSVVRELSFEPLTKPELSDKEVSLWIQRAKVEYFEFPEWVFDRHTARGKRKKRGYAHFFDEAAKLKNPSFILGKSKERAVFERARTLYLEEEKRYGKANTSSMRARWRAEAKVKK